MKILVVSQNYWPEPFSTDDLCEGLASMGHSVTVLTGLPNYPEGVIPAEYRRGRNRRQEKGGVDIVRARVVPRGPDLRGVNKARRVLNYASFPVTGSLLARGLGPFDAVLAIQMSPVSMVEPAVQAARRWHVPLVVYCYDLWPEDLLTGGVSREGLVYRALKAYSQSVYSKADAIAVTSPGFECYLRGFLGVEGPKYYELPQYAEELFESLGALGVPAEHDGFDIVFAGNVGGNQGLESAVEAMALLPESSRARLHVYGTGSRLGACEALSRGLGLGERVAFHGRRPLQEMPAVYASADAMLLTLARPANGSLVPVLTVPRKLQSYLAAGKPVLAAADGAASDVVSDARCGKGCPSGDPKALAAAIVELEAMGHEGLSELGARAHAYYERRYSRALFFERLGTILQEVKR